MSRAVVSACFVLVVAATASRADACTCVITPDRCLALSTADAVFEATVESIALSSLEVSTPRSPEDLTLLSGPVRVVTLRDVKPVRGQPQTTVVTPAESSACGYEFRAGARYVIVATREPDGRLSVFFCGLTSELSDSRGVQEYLQTLAGPPSGTRVWGQVSTVTRWVDRLPDTAGVAGSRVSITGPEQRSFTTGADGWFSFTDLPHGTYTVSVEPPGAAPVLRAMTSQVIDLASSQPHACAETNFLALPRNSISGIVSDENGNPFGGLAVEFDAADALDPLESSRTSTTTDTNGRYRLDGLPPGRYRVRVNVRRVGAVPAATFFESYAVQAPSGESVVTVGPGDAVALRPVIVPRLNTAVVSGTVRDADGAPVRGVDVFGVLFGQERTYPVAPVTTDGEGRFALQVWVGRRYRLSVGSRSNPDGEIEFVAGESPLTIVLQRR